MIFKIVLKNVLKKKLRSLLIILTLLLTTCIIFVTLGASNMTEKVVLETSKKYVGDSDITILCNNNSPYPSFDLINNKDYEYAVGFVDIDSRYKDKENVVLRGATLSDLETVWNMQGIESIGENNFFGNKAIISKEFSEKYGIKAGDELTVSVDKKKETLIVAAVVNNTGIFLNDGEDQFIVVPKNYLQTRMGYGTRINKEVIKLIDKSEKNNIIQTIQQEYNGYDVKPSILQSDIQTAVNTQTSPYKVISIIVVLLTINIIISIFKIISYERTTDIACIRSLGGTRKVGLSIIIFEGLLYSIIASILGCLLGMGAMYIIVSVTLPENLVNLNIHISFNLIQFVIPCIITIIVSFIGIITPCLSLYKKSIKNLLFRIDDKKYKKRSIANLIVGLLLISLAVFFPIKIVPFYQIEIEILLIGALIVGFLIIAVYIVKLISGLIGRLLQENNGSVAYLAIKNIKEDFNILSNIRLLMVGLALFLLAYSVISSVVANTSDLYRDNARFNLFVWYDSSENKSAIENMVYSCEGISSIYTSMYSYSHDIVGTNYSFAKIQSVDISKYNDYWNVNSADNNSSIELLKKLDSGRNIIITSIMKDRLGVNVGDYINIRFDNKIIPYKIVGFVDSLNSNGNNGLISDKYFSQDITKNYYMDTSIFTNKDENEVVKELQSVLSGKKVIIKTVNAMEQNNYEAYRGIYTMLKVLTVIILALCVIGITNNQIINFIQRKKYFSIQRSIGMSRKQLSWLLIIEAVLSGFIGGIIAVLLGNLLIYIIPNFIKSTGQVMAVSYSVPISISCMALGIVLSVITEIVLAVKSFKMSIIDSIKYE